MPTKFDFDFFLSVDRKTADGITKILDKLAAYKDTGLEPSEIPTGLELANVYAAMQGLKRYKDAEEQGLLAMLPGALVHCRECKNSKLQKVVGNGIDEPPYIAGLFCRKFGLFPMKDADFCSYGERRETNGAD